MTYEQHKNLLDLLETMEDLANASDSLFRRLGKMTMGELFNNENHKESKESLNTAIKIINKDILSKMIIFKDQFNLIYKQDILKCQNDPTIDYPISSLIEVLRIYRKHLEAASPQNLVVWALQTLRFQIISELGKVKMTQISNIRRRSDYMTSPDLHELKKHIEQFNSILNEVSSFKVHSVMPVGLISDIHYEKQLMSELDDCIQNIETSNPLIYFELSEEKVNKIQEKIFITELRTHTS